MEKIAIFVYVTNPGSLQDTPFIKSFLKTFVPEIKISFNFSIYVANETNFNQEFENAVKDGCDYFLIANFNFEIGVGGNYIEAFVDSIRQRRNVGTIGFTNDKDRCTYQLAMIHRSHYEIFGYLFPPLRSFDSGMMWLNDVYVHTAGSFMFEGNELLCYTVDYSPEDVNKIIEYTKKLRLYYLAVMSTFKNETMNLKAWLDHYIWQGVEHFYLIDNGSTDNPLAILKEYIDKGLVTYYYFPERPKPGKNLQEENVRRVFDTSDIKPNVFWIVTCDLDEFYYGKENPLREVLASMENEHYIVSLWKMFGSSGLTVHPQDIRTAIVNRKPELSDHGKYIYKPTCIFSSDLLKVHYIDGNIFKTENESIQLNHYVIQSLEYFQKVKMTRGDACYTGNVRDISYFIGYDKGNDFVDEELKNLIKKSAYRTQNLKP